MTGLLLLHRQKRLWQACLSGCSFFSIITGALGNNWSTQPNIIIIKRIVSATINMVNRLIISSLAVDGQLDRWVWLLKTVPNIDKKLIEIRNISRRHRRLFRQMLLFQTSRDFVEKWGAWVVRLGSYPHQRVWTERAWYGRNAAC